MCRAGLMVVGIRAMKNKEPTVRMAPKYMVTKQMESHSDAAEDERTADLMGAFEACDVRHHTPFPDLSWMP